MQNNLLIIGAGIYGEVAKEIAESMALFDRIDFLDDRASQTPLGGRVIGTTEMLPRLCGEYNCAVVAIGNPTVRASLLERIKQDGAYRIATLISPLAFVSKTASVGCGCIVEPMAVVHAGCVLEEGCLISAGAVVNHASTCGCCVHVDCNATVAGYTAVPAGTKVPAGTVYTKQEQ